ncbi:MAG TPA: FAD-dependent oxidoreductase, partial [Acidimicrobiales bacterium]|nr:FAD-dependent oxidoreductase [Acidimicrobiales bacterium]
MEIEPALPADGAPLPGRTEATRATEGHEAVLDLNGAALDLDEVALHLNDAVVDIKEASPAEADGLADEPFTGLQTERGAGTADSVVVIGAGPAGLTAAYELARLGQTCTVLEADEVVGGISRTVVRDGWRFDIGGHRFFTKVKVVEDFWHEILPGEDFMLRPRLSRIYYKGKYYDYPLRPFNAVRNLGLFE